MSARPPARLRWLWAALFGYTGIASPAFAGQLALGADEGIAWWRVAAALVLCLMLAVAGAFALRFRLRVGAGAGAGIGAPRVGMLKGWATLAAALPRLVPAAQPDSRRLRLVETLRLSHQLDLCLLECDGDRLLVAATPQGLVVLKHGEGAGEAS